MLISIFISTHRRLDFCTYFSNIWLSSDFYKLFLIFSITEVKQKQQNKHIKTCLT